jgi:hypothetical protein
MKLSLLLGVLFLLLLGALVVQLSEQVPFTSEIVDPIPSMDSCERVSQDSAESCEFFLGALVSSHRESDRVG